MNYIKHLTGFFEKITTDFDLNPTHISLYMAIFQLWNQNRFRNPISISRDELMSLSKIGSNATYHKCIKGLNERHYVNYMPSYSQFRGTTLEVISLESYRNPLTQKGLPKHKSCSSIKQPIEQAGKQELNSSRTGTELLPYINNTNLINIANGSAPKNEEDQDLFFSRNGSASSQEFPKKMEDSSAETVPPPWEAVLLFFESNHFPEVEAQKFYNYFESIGWLVGGKSPMKDWQAAARNWMLKAVQFAPSSPSPQAQHLHTPNSKNYDEAL